MKYLRLSVALVASCLGSAVATAQGLNVSVLVAEPQWSQSFDPIARQIIHEKGLKVMSLKGATSVEALHDLATSEDIDAAVISADVLAYASQNELLPNGLSEFRSLAKLSPVTLMLVAPLSVTTIDMLEGKKISSGQAGSSAFVASELILPALGLSMERKFQPGLLALDALEQGLVDAALVRAEDVAKTRLDSGRFHVLPLPFPDSLRDIYAPAALTQQDFPGLIRNEEVITTLATATIIAVRETKPQQGWKTKMKAFSNVLYGLSNAGVLAPDINLNATVPGWKRSFLVDGALKAAPIVSSTTEGGSP